MPAVSKAVLLNIGAFLADNNIRRNVGSFTYNYPSQTASVVTHFLTLNPSETTTWVTPMASSALTFLSCNGPLSASVTLRPSGGYDLEVNRLHIVDSDVGQLVLTNPGTSAVNVAIIQA
jgi:hypothetical protein